MSLHQLRRWHWVVIGALAGAAVGGGRAAWGPGYRYSNAPTLSQPLFERATLAPPGTLPRASGLVVHPADETKAFWVTGQYEQPNAPRPDADGPAVRTSAFKFRAPTPYQPGFAADVADPSRFTVADYLDQVAARVPQAGLSYRYAWEEQPALGLLAWLAGSTLLIGGAWPVLLRRLPGAPPPIESAESPDAPPRRAAPAVVRAHPRPGTAVPEADRSLDAYFDVVGGRRAAEPGNDAAPSAVDELRAGDQEPAPMPRVCLAAAPLESAAAPRVDEHKDFGGEYYPTVVHGKDSRSGRAGAV